MDVCFRSKADSGTLARRGPQAGWNLAQNKKAARTTGTAPTGKGQKYMNYEMNNVYISQ